MDLPKIYDPSSVEDKWYAYWLENHFFHSIPDDREPFTIVMPPPNVTGILHMGHMLNNTIQDVLIRRARMLGKNACWVPGTDHASIATEAKVVDLLRQSGRTKHEIGREQFLIEAYEWKEKYGGIILQQLKKLGASCDWDRTRFTMEPDLSASVIEQFIRLYHKGYIYRGARMVNWDPMGKTAVSDEEVIYKSTNSTLYYINYKIAGIGGEITIATTRPETIFADVAICLHPEDSRYTHLHGQKAIIPLLGREIPIIIDEKVNMEFGTGCLKITPAHSLIDYEIGLKHKLPVIDILCEDGTLNDLGGAYAGMDRFLARKKIVEDLEKDPQYGLKSESYTSQIGFSERTNSVIEPRISTQWFLKMDQLSEPALLAFMHDKSAPEKSPAIHLIPDKYLNTYRHWMENVHDWCISRQLWWGQQIPAWYNETGDFVVAKTEKEALHEFRKKGIEPVSLRQDEDVLDTWFSSWLWPITVFDGIKNPGNKDFTYYYPTQDLVTAPEILFFWVARMVMIGIELTGVVPFKKVYLTGIVRDKQGRKMSKSLGNSPDPLVLIDQYGADAIRMGLLLSSPAGNDLLYDESLVQQGRNFANKIWNAFRLIESWSDTLALENDSPKTPNPVPIQDQVAIYWFRDRLKEVSETIPGMYQEYRLSEILMILYRLIWDDFCGWYLEMIKPTDHQTLHLKTYQKTVSFFKVLIMHLHPIMPFITEELWQFIRQSKFNTAEKSISSKDQSIMFARVDQIGAELMIELEFETNISDKDIDRFSPIMLSDEVEKIIKPSISEIRNIRNKYQIGLKKGLKLGFISNLNLLVYQTLYQKLAGIERFEKLDLDPLETVNFSIGKVKFYLWIDEKLDKEAERTKLMLDIKYTEGFLSSVMVKLNNEKFMANAKTAVKELEIRKKEDAESKLKDLQESLRRIDQA